MNLHFSLGSFLQNIMEHDILLTCSGFILLLKSRKSSLLKRAEPLERVEDCCVRHGECCLMSSKAGLRISVLTQ